VSVPRRDGLTGVARSSIAPPLQGRGSRARFDDARLVSRRKWLIRSGSFGTWSLRVFFVSIPAMLCAGVADANVPSCLSRVGTLHGPGTLHLCPMPDAEYISQPLSLCPVDLHKVLTGCSTDAVTRYNALTRFYEQHGWAEHLAFVRSRLALL
jgi:hypothetical protein